MIGTNEIIFCNAQMLQAVEHYLNTQVFAENHRVTILRVSELNGIAGSEFKIITEPKIITEEIIIIT